MYQDEYMYSLEIYSIFYFGTVGCFWGGISLFTDYLETLGPAVSLIH